MPGKLQGFLDGFQAQLTAQAQIGDNTLSFPTSGMIPGLRYQFRIDDTNPPTTFEFVEVEFQDANTAVMTPAPGGRGIGGTTAAFHPQGAWVTGILLKESMLPTFARLDTENLMAFASASVISGQIFNAYGAPGANTQPTRYVGATTGGAPTSGPFLVGDFVLDTANNVIWICTSPGSPGTWQNILDGTNTGLTGAVSSLTRWVGATGGGAPASGTWKQGDVVTDRNGLLRICAIGGTPGTWYALGPVIFAETLLGAIAASVSFTGIPSTFRNLKARLFVKEDGVVNSDFVLMRFNNVSTGTYDSDRFGVGAATYGTPVEVLGGTSMQVGALTGATATAGYFGQVEISVNNYSGTTGNKLAIGQGNWASADTSGALNYQSFVAKWRTIATAVNEVDFIPGTGNFIAGSLFVIQLEP